MAKVGYKLTGVPEVDAILKRLPIKIANKLAQDGYKEAAKHVLDEAQARVHVRSGNLKKSLKIRAIKARKLKAGAKVVSTKKRKRKKKSIPVPLSHSDASIAKQQAAASKSSGKSSTAAPEKNPDGYYSHMEEFGTKFRPAHPTLIPALAAAKEKVNATLENHVARQVAEAQAGNTS